MSVYKAREATAEVSSDIVLGIIQAVGDLGPYVRDLLIKGGVVESQLKEGEWINEQVWLDGLKHIDESLGRGTLFNIGKQIPSLMNITSDFSDFESAVETINKAYHQVHRGGEIGDYQIVDRSDYKISIVCDTPYPSDFDRGIITAMARIVTPEDTLIVRVMHDDNAECKHKSAESCTYNLTW